MLRAAKHFWSQTKNSGSFPNSGLGMEMGSKLRFRAKVFTRNWSFECNCVPNPEIGNENFERLEIRLTVMRLCEMTLTNGCCIVELPRNIRSVIYFHCEFYQLSQTEFSFASIALAASFVTSLHFLKRSVIWQFEISLPDTFCIGF